MDSTHVSEAEPGHSPEIIPVDSNDAEPEVTHTKLSPLSDSLSFVALSPKLPSSYVPLHSPSSKATSQSPGIAPSPRLPIDQVTF